MANAYEQAEQILDAIEGIYGPQGEHRAVHAKGTLLAGEFRHRPRPRGSAAPRTWQAIPSGQP